LSGPAWLLLQTPNPSIERTFQRRFAPLGPPLMSNV